MLYLEKAEGLPSPWWFSQVILIPWHDLLIVVITMLNNFRSVMELCQCMGIVIELSNKMFLY